MLPQTGALAEGLVGRDDEAGPLVAAGDELEGPVGGHGLVGLAVVLPCGFTELLLDLLGARAAATMR
jgi:hypothetical protein